MRERIIKILSSVVSRGVTIQVTASDDILFGHYNTNVAFTLAKKNKVSPMVAANDLCEKLRTKRAHKLFERIEVAKPGFINFWISPETFHKELKIILRRGARYGKSPSRGVTGKVQLEFVSANPTGPLTLANGRGGFFGDVLANILEWNGYKVEREYYVNDTGNQVVTLGKSLAAARKLIRSEETHYKGGYIEEWANEHATLIKQFYKDPLKLGQCAAKDFLANIKNVLKRSARIYFTRFTSEERHIHKKGLVKKVMQIFESRKLTYKDEQALWLRTTSFGDDKDRVLITRDGFPTYFLADAGHYLETKTRGFHTKINILGPDHYGYVKRIQAAAQIVGIPKSEVIVTQAIRITRNGKEYKMSKRRGTFLTFEELIREVGMDVARFFFLMISVNTHLDFDFALAKERSVKNPVFYLQYGYVRAINILKKSKNITSKSSKLNKLTSPEELALMQQLVRFSETLKDVGRDRSIHMFTKYSLELAKSFHLFYERHRVVGERNEIAAARRVLVQASVIVFQNLFTVLGISAPKKM